MHLSRLKPYLWSLLIGVWLIEACTASEDNRPDNLIDEDRMAAILTEVHIAEARVSRLNLSSIDSSNIAYKHAENQIFKKFGIDTATYRKSYTFYSSHPADMEAIYKKVTQTLTKQIGQKRSPHS